MRIALGFCFGLALLSCSLALHVRVGTKETKPFTFKNSQNVWVGFSVGVLDLVKKQIEIDTGKPFTYSFEEYENLRQVFNGLEDREVSIAHSAITKTQPREARFDLTHSYFPSGFKIMTHARLDTAQTIWDVMVNFFQPSVVIFMCTLAVSILVIANIVWFIEIFFPDEKRDSFNSHYRQGIKDSIMWTALTIFQKKPPEQPKGNIAKTIGTILSILGMFILMTSTGLITVAIQNSRTRNQIETLNDLQGKKVGSVNATVSEQYIITEGGSMIPTVYPTVDKMFEGFHRFEVDAVIYDYPILQYHVQQRKLQGIKDTLIVGDVFEKQYYGMAVRPENATLTETLDQALLQVVDSYDYLNLYDKWINISDDAEKEGPSTTTYLIFFGFFVGGAVILIIVLILVARFRHSQKLAKDEGIIETPFKMFLHSVSRNKARRAFWNHKLKDHLTRTGDLRTVKDGEIPFKTYESMTEALHLMYLMCNKLEVRVSDARRKTLGDIGRGCTSRYLEKILQEDDFEGVTESPTKSSERTSPPVMADVETKETAAPVQAEEKMEDRI